MTESSPGRTGLEVGPPPAAAPEVGPARTDWPDGPTGGTGAAEETVPDGGDGGRGTAGAAGIGTDGGHARRPAEDRSPSEDRSPAVHPRVWQRRMAVLREQAHRRLRYIVGGVAVLVALCVVLLVLHTPLLALRNATVRGAQHTGSQAVLQAAGLLAHPPLIDVDPKSVAADVEKLPWVAHAVVIRHWPDSVTIIVSERAPLGSMARPGGGAALVDRTGRVLEWQAGAPTGLVLAAPLTPGRPGTVLGRAARPALDVAAALPASLAGRVTQVSVTAAGAVTVSLGRGVSAVLGTTAELPAKLTALATVLADAHVSAPAVINVTFPDEPTVGRPPPRP